MYNLIYYNYNGLVENVVLILVIVFKITNHIAEKFNPVWLTTIAWKVKMVAHLSTLSLRIHRDKSVFLFLI